MKSFYQLIVVVATVLLLAIGISHSAFAQANDIDDGPLKENELLANPEPNDDGLRESHAGNPNWITKWYGPDGNYENSGGFGTTAEIDLISEGTGGQITDASLSTLSGLLLSQELDVEWGDDHGGTRGWEVFEIDPADGNNMNRGGPVDNIETYAVIVIDAPSAMTSIMSPAHDDHAHIWINGEKWYNNSRWSGGARTILHNVEVELQKGANVLLYRCGEGGGSAYFNLHFDDATHDAVTIYPKDSTDQQSFFDEIAPVTPVEPVGKLTTTWGDIKRK